MVEVPRCRAHCPEAEASRTLDGTLSSTEIVSIVVRGVKGSVGERIWAVPKASGVFVGALEWLAQPLCDLEPSLLSVD